MLGIVGFEMVDQIQHLNDTYSLCKNEIINMEVAMDSVKGMWAPLH